MTALSDGLLDLRNRPGWYYSLFVILSTASATASGALGIVADGGATVTRVLAGGGSAGFGVLTVSWLLAFWAKEGWRIARLNKLPAPGTPVQIDATQPVRIVKPAHPELIPIPSQHGDWRAEARRTYAETTGPFRRPETVRVDPNAPDPNVLRMWKFAQAYPRKLTLSERNWDDGKPFGGGEYQLLLRYMIDEKIIDWKHPTAKTQGRDFTRQGMAIMRFYQTRPTAPPWPDVPGSYLA